MEVDDKFFVASSSPLDKESMLLTYKTIMEPDKHQTTKAVVSSPSDATLTVRAALVGNVMLLYNVESAPILGYPSCAIILERCVVQLEDPTPILPYPFSVVQYDRKYWFSCFAEEDRAEWVRAIVSCSYEMLRTGLARFQEQIVDAEMSNKFSRLANYHDAGFERCSTEEMSCRNPNSADQWKQLEHLYARPMCRSFKVPRGDQEMITLCEHMAEPKVALTVPAQLLDSTCRVLTSLLDHLTGLTYLPEDLETRRIMHLQSVGAVLANVRQSVDYVSAFQGSPFKSSLCKEVKSVSFLPTNLHIQSVSLGKGDSADYFTCGAFTAYSEGYDRGGLKSIVSELSESTMPSVIFDGDLKKVVNKLRSLNFAAESIRTFRSEVEKVFQGEDVAAVVEQCRQSVSQAKKLYTTMSGQYQEKSGSKLNVLTEQLGCWFAQAGPTASTLSVQSMLSHGDDFEVEIASLHTKVENMATCQEYTSSNEGEVLVSLHQSAQALIKRLESVHLTLSHGYLVEMLNCLVASETVNTFYQLFHRYSIVLSQAISSVIAVLLNALWLSNDEEFTVKVSLWAQSGALISIHSLLSCFQSERSMIEDMLEIASFIRSRCKCRIVHATRSDDCSTPTVEGDLGSIKINLPVSECRWKRLPQSLRQGELFQVKVVLWNVGVNQEQSLSIKFREAALEAELNEAAIRLMERYCLTACQRGDHPAVDEQSVKESLGAVRGLNSPGRWKNVDLLHGAMRLTRLVHGDVVICCKSGKDRTSMAVTYDEALLVQRLYNLSDQDTSDLAALLRSEGTRIENAYKNLGTKRYAFKKRHLQYLPDCYKPPEGFYASLTT